MSQRVETQGGDADTLLLAARACAVDVGVRRTSMADIARRAGVSRATVYRRFPDAPSLWSAVLTREMGEVVEAAEADAASGRTARERLVAALVAGVAALREDVLVRRILDLDPAWLLPYVTDRLGTSQRHLVDLLERRIREGGRDGSIRVADVRTSAYLLQSVARDLVLSARVAEAECDPKALLEEVAVMLDGYLQGATRRRAPQPSRSARRSAAASPASRR